MTTMKRFRIILFFALLPIVHAQEVRIWTSASGKTIEASFVERQYDQAVLQMPGGEKMKIRLNQLSRTDQIYVDSQVKIGDKAGSLPSSSKVSAKAPIPPELEALFGRHLVNAKGKKVSTAELAGKKIGIYFSSSGCPGCRSFTPRLIASYNQRKAQGQPFEVVLVTGDIDERHMRAYMKDYQMPWFAVPFGDKHIQILQKKFAVAFIPKFVEIDALDPACPAKVLGNDPPMGDAPTDNR